MKTIVINLLGAAGSGKSSLAGELFGKLKKAGYNCEYVQEFVKKSVYEGNSAVLKNQLFVLANQYYNIDLLRDKVDIIITDSPLLLSIFYNKYFDKSNSFRIPDEIFEGLTMYVHSTFDNLNYFIKRNHEYKREGRYQDETRAREEEKILENLMDNVGIEVKHLLSTDDCASIIMEDVKKRYEFYKNLEKSGNEIERKFLVSSLPFSLKDEDCDKFVQGYLKSNEREKRVRAVNDEKFYLTEKYGHGVKREEFEKEITREDFQNLLQDVDGELIKKRRYYLDVGAKNPAELDVYFGHLAGLKTVEVEFSSIDESNAFIVPDWFGEEVTNDKKFKNKSLAKSGFKEITASTKWLTIVDCNLTSIENCLLIDY